MPTRNLAGREEATKYIEIMRTLLWFVEGMACSYACAADLARMAPVAASFAQQLMQPRISASSSAHVCFENGWRGFSFVARAGLDIFNCQTAPSSFSGTRDAREPGIHNPCDCWGSARW